MLYNITTNILRICKAYDEIAEKVGRQPGSTAELVDIIEFLNQSIDSTIYKLEFKIGEAKKRLLFLMDYALIPSIVFFKKSFFNSMKLNRFFIIKTKI